MDFLDITLDLELGTYSPYTKPNDTPLYVHSGSNRPPSILKNIPLAVNDRLSAISSNKEIFNKAVPPYQKSLEDSGFTHKLEYKPPTPRTGNRCRKRNIIWFNPPFSLNVKTKVGEKNLKIVDKCFP